MIINVAAITNVLVIYLYFLLFQMSNSGEQWHWLKTVVHRALCAGIKSGVQKTQVLHPNLTKFQGIIMLKEGAGHEKVLQG